MEDEFVPVNTWQGTIMVSNTLLPQSLDEKTRIYPDNYRPAKSSLRVNPASALSRENRSHLTIAPPPPIPNFWHHETLQGYVAVNGYGFEPSLPRLAAPDVAASSGWSVPSQSPVFTPQTDEDVVSIPDVYPSLFSPWESGFIGPPGCSPSGWEDLSLHSNAHLFPNETCYSLPPSPVLTHPRSVVDRTEPTTASSIAPFSMPTRFSEIQGSIKRRRLDSERG